MKDVRKRVLIRPENVKAGFEKVKIGFEPPLYSMCLNWRSREGPQPRAIPVNSYNAGTKRLTERSPNETALENEQKDTGSHVASHLTLVLGVVASHSVGDRTGMLCWGEKLTCIKRDYRETALVCISFSPQEASHSLSY